MSVGRVFAFLTVLSFAAMLGLACSGDEIKLDDYRKQVGDLFATYEQDLGGLSPDVRPSGNQVENLFTAYDSDLAQLTSQLKTEGTQDEVFASLGSFAADGLDRTMELRQSWTALAESGQPQLYKDGGDLIDSYVAAFEDLSQGAAAQDNAARDRFNEKLSVDIPDRVRQFEEAVKTQRFASLSAYAGSGSDRTAQLLAAWDALKVPDRAKNVHEQGRRLIVAYKAAFDTLKQGADAQDEGAREAFNAALQGQIPAELKAFQDALNGLS